MCLLLELDEDGLSNEARLLFEVAGDGLFAEDIMLVTAEAADLAMDTVMGDGTIIFEVVAGVASRILLIAILAFWSLGVTVVPARGCKEVDSLKRPFGIPG